MNDLLVAPLQHTTKLPLLLAPIRKYTPDESERNLLSEAIGKLETSLRKYIMTSTKVSNDYIINFSLKLKLFSNEDHYKLAYNCRELTQTIIKPLAIVKNIDTV